MSSLYLLRSSKFNHIRYELLSCSKGEIVSTHLLTHISTYIHTYTSYIYSYPPYIYAHTCCIPNIDPHTLIPPRATTLSAQMVWPINSLRGFMVDQLIACADVWFTNKLFAWINGWPTNRLRGYDEMIIFIYLSSFHLNEVTWQSPQSPLGLAGESYGRSDLWPIMAY